MPDFARQRAAMVREQLVPRGIRDPRVLDAMAAVPREAFVDPDQQAQTYRDRPLPIGFGQTISQPLVVAEMIQAAGVEPGDNVLEVGAGSGYAAAVLAQLAKRVHAIERHPDLARQAGERLERLGYTNAHIHTGDGSFGLPEHAPFNAIIVSAGGPAVPDTLCQQLATGGRLVIPVGPHQREQQLVRVHRQPDDHFHQQTLGLVSFVPLIGEGGWADNSG